VNLFGENGGRQSTIWNSFISSKLYKVLIHGKHKIKNKCSDKQLSAIIIKLHFLYFPDHFPLVYFCSFSRQFCNLTLLNAAQSFESFSHILQMVQFPSKKEDFYLENKRKTADYFDDDIYSPFLVFFTGSL
jgi:hypothetical protein